MQTGTPKRTRSGAAVWYRVYADLRSRRVQTASMLLVVMLSTLLVGLGLVVIGSVQAPFDRLFTQLNGAHLWLVTSSYAPFTQEQLATITHAPNVVATTDLEEQSLGYVLIGSSRLSTKLYSFPVQQPAVGRLLITQGKALSAQDPDGIIIDQAFATSHHLHVDDTLTLITPGGEQSIHVRGIAIDVNHDSRVDGTVCQLHLLRDTLDRLYPPSQRYGT